MTTRNLLTKPVERQISADWQREIPSLGIYQPRHLLRRVGPLLVGVCLERDSGGAIYKPLFHVHFLGRETPTVFLTLFTKLRSDRSGGPDYVQVRFHEEQYKDAAARMTRQSLLPLEGDLRLVDVMDAYRRYMQTTMGRIQSVSLYLDMILLSAWAGNQAEAIGCLAECLQWPDKTGFRFDGGPAALETVCRKRIEQPTLIQEMVVTQIAALGVDEVPVSDLVR